jgi:flagellar biosynthesis/type III secretory pathway protein FliH
MAYATAAWLSIFLKKKEGRKEGRKKETKEKRRKREKERGREGRKEGRKEGREEGRKEGRKKRYLFGLVWFFDFKTGFLSIFLDDLEFAL